jgi:hypothetical protein
MTWNFSVRRRCRRCKSFTRNLGYIVADFMPEVGDGNPVRRRRQWRKLAISFSSPFSPLSVFLFKSLKM